jgi:hypothetical protein
MRFLRKAGRVTLRRAEGIGQWAEERVKEERERGAAEPFPFDLQTFPLPSALCPS